MKRLGRDSGVLVYSAVSGHAMRYKLNPVQVILVTFAMTLGSCTGASKHVYINEEPNNGVVLSG